MRKLIYIFLFCIGNLHAQPITPRDYGLMSFTINDKKLGDIHFYLDTTNIKKKSPLFIDINGSGGNPLVNYVICSDFHTVYQTFGLNVIEQTKEKYHYIILDKPGTPFCDTIVSPQLLAELDIAALSSTYVYSDEYKKKLSLSWRVEASQKVIAYLIKNGYWDKTDIVAYGYSEGGQVVPSLALKEKRITHIVSMVGSGLNQFYDAIIDFRMQAECGLLAPQQAQDSIDEWFKAVENVYRNPSSATEELGGHSYLRGASFCAVDNLMILRQLDIPIFIVAGTEDKSSPILGLDYIRLEFLRVGKTNLTYETCVGCNHYLENIKNGEVNAPDYLLRILDWVKEN